YARQTSDNATATDAATNTAAVSTPANVANTSGSNNERTQSQPQIRASVPEKPSAKFTAVSTPAAVEPSASSGSKSPKFVDANRPSPNAKKSIATVDSASVVNAPPDVAETA